MSRATGWPESYLLTMPYAKGLIYLHCHLLYQGSATRWACADDAETAQIDAKFSQYLKR